jgi:hypothetical protein
VNAQAKCACYQDFAAEQPWHIRVGLLANRKAEMNVLRDSPSNSRGKKSRQLVLIVGGISILGMLALILLVLLSGFPGPPQGSPDKTEAPPEDVSKARP